MRKNQATMQQQGGKGNLKPAAKKMTTGLCNDRKKLSNFRRGGGSHS